MREPSTGDWRSAFTLLDTLLELPEEQWRGWVDALSPEHAHLKPLLHRLLARHPLILERGFLSQLPMFTRGEPESPAQDATLVRGGVVGPYVLIEPLGAGGMSSVWLAERLDGLLSRQVALKLPRVGWAMPDFAARLAQERQLLSSLEHPRIARLYDAGIAADGRPWLALELVRGRPIDVYCAEGALTIRARLRLILQVAEAVAYAHSRLIVHRDLKPSNILVDAEGNVHLLDFGIGKLLEPDSSEPGLTQMGARAFTPEYASPEQLRGDTVTTATDIYSLGVVFYQLLTGRRPHQRQAGQSLEHVVATEDAVAPSRAVDAQGLDLDHDLDAIVLETLEKEPTQRYATVAALAEDIVRYLRGEAVHARRGSPWYRAGKVLRRHRLLVAAGALILVALLAGGAVAIWQARVARSEAARAEAVQKFMTSIFLENSRDQSDPLSAQNTTARQLLDAAAVRLKAPDNAGLPDHAVNQLRGLIGGLYYELGLYNESQALFELRIASLRKLGAGGEVELAGALAEQAESMQQTDRFAAGLPLLREAEGIAKRHPHEERLAGLLDSYLANQLQPSDPQGALNYAERAVILLGRTDPHGDEMLGALFMNATAKKNTDPAAAEIAAKQALELVTATRGVGHELYCETALILGEIQGSRMEESADATFKAAEAVADKVTAPGHYARLQTDLRYGAYLADEGRSAEATLRLQRALRAALAARGRDDQTYVAWAHLNLAIAAWRSGDLQAAQAETAETLRIYRLQAPDGRLAKTAETGFDVSLARGDLEGARALLRELRATRQANGTTESPGFREALWAREAWLALASGDAAGALPRFMQVSRTEVPMLQRFVEVQIGARVGAARAARLLNDPIGARQNSAAALQRVAALGNPSALRQVAAAALLEMAAAESSMSHCQAALDAQRRADALLAQTEGPASFRLNWPSAPMSCQGRPAG